MRVSRRSDWLLKMEQLIVCRKLEGLTLVLTLFCGHEKRVQHENAKAAAQCAVVTLGQRAIPCEVCKEMASTELLKV